MEMYDNDKKNKERKKRNKHYQQTTDLSHQKTWNNRLILCSSLSDRSLLAKIFKQTKKLTKKKERKEEKTDS